MRSITVSDWSIILQDIKQNCWTGKYRSLTYINFKRSIFVSYWSIIQSMTFIHQTVFKLLSKVIGPWKIGHWPTYVFLGQPLCHPNPLSQVWHSSIKQSWRYQAKSLDCKIYVIDLHIFYKVNLCVTWSIITSMTFLHQIVFKILSKVTGPWKLSHWPTYNSWGQSLCHTDPSSKVWHSFIKQS